ncbi:MAG: diguanylate cyclase [Spirochaetota bacterium]
MGLRKRVLELSDAPYTEEDALKTRKIGSFLAKLQELSRSLHSELTQADSQTATDKDTKDSSAEDLLSDWEEEALHDTPISIAEEDTLDTEDVSNTPDDIEVSNDEYLALIDMSREIIKSTSFQEFFENLMYAILAQYGVESILLFTNLNILDQPLKIVNYDGIEVEEDLILDPNSKIYKMLSVQKKIVLVDDAFTESLDEYEKSILVLSNAAIIIPVFLDVNLFTIIFAGKMISDESYSAQDLKFITTYTDFAGDYFRNIIQYEDKNKTLQSLTSIARTSLDSFVVTEKIALAKDLREYYTSLGEYLDTVIGIDRYTILYQEPEQKSEYRVLGSNVFASETIASFTLRKQSSDLIARFQEGEFELYPVEDYLQSHDLSTLLPQEEKEKMSELIMLPLWVRDNLQGILFIHRMAQEFSETTLTNFLKVCKFSATILAKLLLELEKSKLEKNPFHLIEDILDSEIDKASKNNSQFSMLIIKIQSINRIINLLGQDFFRSYNNELWKIIAQNIGEEDYISKVGQGKYAIILSEVGKKNAELFINRVKSGTLAIKNPHKDFNISIQIYLLIYPEQTTDRRKFLEMLEET